MTQGPSQVALTPAVLDAAAAWIVRVESDAATAEDWRALTDWLEASEAHLAAYEALSALWREAGAQPALLSARLQRQARERVRGASSAPLGAALAAGFALLAVLGLGGWTYGYGLETRYQTAPGETRVIDLPDGSRLTLGPRSQARVRIGAWRRAVHLGEAEAAFQVAKDPRHPFVIDVGDQQVRVVGTEFVVRHVNHSIDVTVRHGVVEVLQPSAGPAPLWRLTAGQQSTHQEGEAQTTRRQVDPAAAFAWTEGRLVCQDENLSELVQEISRRYPIPVSIEGPAAQRRFTGVLELDDEERLVERLAAFLDLTVRRSKDGIVLRAKDRRGADRRDLHA